MTFGLTPHPAQVNILNDNHNTVVVAASRRFGKTQTAIMFLLRACLDFDRWIARRGNPGYQISATSPAIVAVVLPTRSMAKSLYWQPLMTLIERNPELKKLVKNINNTELTISWKGNRPDLVLGGSGNDGEADRWRGRKIVALITDEQQDIGFSAVQDVLKIAMADVKGSQHLAIGTPKGRGLNALWRLRLLAQDFPEYYSFHHYTAYDNIYFGREAIEQERLTKSPASFKRELLADFLDFPGKVFTELSEDNLVTVSGGVPSRQLTIMGVDFGSQNSAIGIIRLAKDPQDDGHRFELIYGWQNKTGGNLSGFEFYEVVLRLAKRFDVSCCLADPSRPDSIFDLRTIGKKQNVPGLVKTLSGFNKINQGNGQLNDLFFQNKLVFLDLPKEDKNHITGSEAYELASSYHYATDRDGQVTEKIAEGQDDHILDGGLRYALARADTSNLKRLLLPEGVKPKNPKSDLDSLLLDPAFALAEARSRRVA